jgi:hypothetical protein
MKTIEDILQDADDQCENANYHDMIGLAENLFESIKSLVHEDDHFELAKKIRKEITKNI